MASLIPGYEYDIFISYRQNDNKYDGWVTEFINNLNKELEATIKDKITVYFDANPHDGLLETHLVSRSLEDKLKCLIFIPILSRTYCDPKSFAWNNEFLAFLRIAEPDEFGLNIKLGSGNFASRILPVRIHDLDPEDIKLVETQLGFIRSVDFIYKSAGVNRPLRAYEDHPHDNFNNSYYRDQINKVANAVDEIIRGLIKLQNIPVQEDIFMKVPQDRIESKKKFQEPEKRKSAETGKTLFEEKPEKKQTILNKNPWVSVTVALIFLLIIVFGIWIINHKLKVRWALTIALPEIEQHYNELNTVAAFNLLQKAGKYISNDPKFQEWKSRIVRNITILTDPPGAEVAIREYSDIDGEWEKLGKTPLDSIKLPASSFYLAKLVKEGYEDVQAVIRTSFDTLNRKMFVPGKIPTGMVYVAGYWDEVKNTFESDKGFFLDRYEVTNKEYKEFVDKGGYRNKEYWKNIFIKNGKTLSWERAMTELTDKTGRPGPSTWEAGDYPDGQDYYPVTGISWYEASAFAEFAGKELPSGDHWDSGAGFYLNDFMSEFGSRILAISNFNGIGPESVGKYHGISIFGTSDMAGNVREWCSNRTNEGKIISGGAWNDASYLYYSWSQLPAFDRSPENGFRCARYIDREKIPESAFRLINLGEGRDYSKEIPVPESVFDIYKTQFLYDSTDLETITEERDESADDWITEKVSFNAAYGNERVIAYLYLPRNASPPFQTMIYFPGIHATWERKQVNSTKYFIDFILKSGRAVMYPVYKGTFERNDGLTSEMSDANYTHQYTDWLIAWIKDIRRSIDYLKIRKDIDADKIGFIGWSWGGEVGGIAPAVEERLKVNILIVGGFSGRAYPEADQINYIPRIRIPVLMFNGKYDAFRPFETNIKPYFELLGTPEKDKRLCLYETGHFVPKSELIKETLNWLDKYFGPVNHLTNK